MNEFFVGQKVVCVNDAETYSPDCVPPALHGTYTVRDLIEVPSFGLAIRVREIVNPLYRHKHVGNVEYLYGAARFRPLESKAIKLFRKIARDVTEGKTVELV